MLRSRLTPVLLIHKGGLVKTINFSKPKYVGDPINAVKIFNEKEADEIMVLDIDASVNGVSPDFELISKLASECRMPLCYGGGVKSISHAKKLIRLGVEKVAVSSSFLENPSLVKEIAEAIGSQSVVCIIDYRYKSGIFKSFYQVSSHNGKVDHKIDLIDLVKKAHELGAGEIVFNSIDHDGLMGGYDLKLIQELKDMVSLPATFLGGCGSYQDMQDVADIWGTAGLAAGSFYVFKGKYRAVLITYPSFNSRLQMGF
mgnify:CR=1 FL=1